MIGTCGITCSDCGAYKATKANDEVMRRQVAEEWSKMYNAEIKSESIVCNGCNSDGPWFHHCEFDCKIRQCAKEKSHQTCAECEEYPCDILAEFHAMVPDAQKTLNSLRK